MPTVTHKIVGSQYSLEWDNEVLRANLRGPDNMLIRRRAPRRARRDLSPKLNEWRDELIKTHSDEARRDWIIYMTYVGLLG